MSDNYFEIKIKYVWIILLLGIFLSALYVRLGSLNQPYFIGPDPWSHYRYTRMIVENNIPNWDNLVLAPEGRPINFDFFVLTAAYSYKLISHIINISLYRWCFWFPALISSLCVVPAYFIGKIIYNKKAGLIGAFLLGVMPSFVSRTPAALFDSDGIAIFLLLLTIAFFVQSIKTNKIIYAGLTGISLGVFSLAWVGWWMAGWLIISTTLLYSFYQYLTSDIKLKNLSIRIIKLLGVVFIIFFIIALSKYNFSSVASGLLGPIHFKDIKSENGPFPNVYISVAEMMRPANWIKGLEKDVYKTTFWFGIAGLIYLGYSTYKKRYGLAFILLIIWTIGTIYASLTAGRFNMFVGIPLSLACGIFMSKTWDFIDKVGENE